MQSTLTPQKPVIHYPESDGKPMADNGKQFVWITIIYGNLAALFRAVADVFVCGNQFWYPVEGNPEIVNAPDVYVVFGRPKGHRSSWKQWEEGGLPMTVVFEILSPSNDFGEMIDKQLWYEEHGVEEYYVYDPEKDYLAVYLRKNDMLRPVRVGLGIVSPRLGIRFDLSGDEMAIYHPDGRPFLSFEELAAERDRERQDFAQRLDETAQRLDETAQRLDEAAQRAARMADLGRKARRGQASAEEVAELERLENEASAP